VFRMCSLSWRQQIEKIGLTLSPEEYAEDDDGMADADGLRARSEQAIGEIAQALIDSPTLHSDLPSAGDVERLERRIRSFSQRLEDVEEQLDDLSRELGTLRRKLAAKDEKKKESAKAP